MGRKNYGNKMERKIVKNTTPEQIYIVFLGKISSGEWKEGDKIPSENELASSLGVSRMSVRAAIQKLNFMGLAKTQSGEGTFIQELSLGPFFTEMLKVANIQNEDLQIKEFKYAIEDACIDVALRTGKAEKYIETLKSIYMEMIKDLKDDDIDAFRDADYRFHLCICYMTENKIFEFLYNAISGILKHDYIGSTEQLLTLRNGKEKLLNHHRNIIGKIECQLSYDARYRAKDMTTLV